MKIKSIIQPGEMLSAEELAGVLGGNGGARSNTNFMNCKKHTNIMS